VSGASNDDRPPMVVAMRWVQQITSIAFEMALPALLGYWLDQRCGTEPWLLVLGAVLGFCLMMRHLVVITAKLGKPQR
jgi:F0F1-type ATP synthase assembly protein I